MLKGTRVLFGDESKLYRDTLNHFRWKLSSRGYSEVVLPAIWEAETFQQKIQGETLGQMWTFTDKGDRECCLIPEATGIIQQLYNEDWVKSKPKPIKLFYEARCYRYERPQKGRYREFTQFGLEILGTITPSLVREAQETLKECIHEITAGYIFKPTVKRGLGYYVEDGFEVECDVLGAQKQVAGGGRYKEGIGWAIGVDRLLLAKEMYEKTLVEIAF